MLGPRLTPHLHAATFQLCDETEGNSRKRLLHRGENHAAEMAMRPRFSPFNSHTTPQEVYLEVTQRDGMLAARHLATAVSIHHHQEICQWALRLPLADQFVHHATSILHHLVNVCGNSGLAERNQSLWNHDQHGTAPADEAHLFSLCATTSVLHLCKLLPKTLNAQVAFAASPRTGPWTLVHLKRPTVPPLQHTRCCPRKPLGISNGRLRGTPQTSPVVFRPKMMVLNLIPVPRTRARPCACRLKRRNHQSPSPTTLQLPSCRSPLL